jgi:hypothetical protein
MKGLQSDNNCDVKEDASKKRAFDSNSKPAHSKPTSSAPVTASGKPTNILMGSGIDLTGSSQ